MAAPIYARLAVTEEELTTLKGLAVQARIAVIEKAKRATTPEEKSFYWARAEAYEPLIEKLDAPFLNDRSRDAEPDEEEEDDE